MNRLLLMITTNTYIPDVNFDENFEKFNPKFAIELLRGFVLPLGILIIFIIVIFNSVYYYRKNYIKGIVQNLIVGSVIIIILVKPSLLFQLGEQVIKIFSYVIGGFLKNV